MNQDQRQALEALGEIQDDIENLIPKLQKAIALCSKLPNAQSIAGQLRSYTLPTLTAFRDDDSQPGSIARLVRLIEEGAEEDE